jgi:hypothetical protein
MSAHVWRSAAGLIGAAVLAAACGGGSPAPEGAGPTGDIGVDVAELSPAIDNPYVAFGSLRRTVHEGQLEGTTVRVESTVRDAPAEIAGVQVTVVDVSEFEDDELVEKTEDYYAQDRAGVVYYMGERVDDYEDGAVIGHSGQWLANEPGNQAGVFMPAAPRVGDAFEQERAPGVAEDRSTVIETGLSVTVPSGSFSDCIRTEDVDPLGGAAEQKVYCRGVGLVRETTSAGENLDLTELETRN